MIPRTQRRSLAIKVWIALTLLTLPFAVIESGDPLLDLVLGLGVLANFASCVFATIKPN